MALYLTVTDDGTKLTEGREFPQEHHFSDSMMLDLISSGAASLEGDVFTLKLLNGTATYNVLSHANDDWTLDLKSSKMKKGGK